MLINRCYGSDMRMVWLQTIFLETVAGVTGIPGGKTSYQRGKVSPQTPRASETRIPFPCHEHQFNTHNRVSKLLIPKTSASAQHILIVLVLAMGSSNQFKRKEETP